ncbi:hypothetical protein A1O7_08995 [Cladophialophora yegresii CBS 114405]|uniref:Uncharacterized protein n=1 Tax=Cladophialophora yegresii CBS 114405 TaxID=1182544 RepID=W9WC09_9EURO|nr:uncharacterized protein A1O7_08995 [Cladophialophora yegresii CBS 114405]EXJ56064.1 hypothetical protein A1O7_08995 [Cladophialophora yegresii CBS 114405]
MPSTTSPCPVKPSSLRLLVLSPSTIPGISAPVSESAWASGPTPAPSSLPTPPLFPAFLEAITGSRPSADVATFSGYTSHPPVRLTTKYYARDVGIWCDELPSPFATPQSPGRRASPGPALPPLSERDARNSLDSNPPSSDEDEAESQRQVSQGVNSDTDIDASTESMTPIPTLTLEDWTRQILSPAAREVRAVIAGIVLLLPISAISTSTTTSAALATRESASASASASHYHDQDPDQDRETERDPLIKLIQTAHTLREAIEDDFPGRDIASLVVLQKASSSSGPGTRRTSPTTTEQNGLLIEQLEERCLELGFLGWEFVAWDGVIRGRDAQQKEEDQMQEPMQAERNKYGERNEHGEKTGLPRVLEVLESVDWSAEPGDGDGGDDGDDLNFDDDEYTDGDDDTLPNMRARTLVGDGASRFGALDFELQREMMELKMSMLGGDDEEAGDDDRGDDSREMNHSDDADQETQIERLPGLVERVVAIREAGLEMGQDERERFAKREIARIMREMG